MILRRVTTEFCQLTIAEIIAAVAGSELLGKRLSNLCIRCFKLGFKSLSTDELLALDAVYDADIVAPAHAVTSAEKKYSDLHNVCKDELIGSVDK